MSKVTIEIDETKRDLKASVVQALADLDQIIANADTLTTAQIRAAIKKLAQHQRVIIKRLVQLS